MWTTLRKFGLDHHDFPTMLDNVSLLLRILTINIYNNVKNPSNVFFYIIVAIGILTYFYVYLFSLVWMVVYRYGRSDIQSAIIVTAMTACNVTGLIKFCFMKIHAQEIKNLVDTYLQCDGQVVPGTRFADNLRRKLRVVKKRASIVWISLVSDGVIYLTMPFLIPGRQFTTDIYIIYGLEPMIETPNYEIANILLITSIGFAIYSMLGAAIFVIAVVGYTESQMHALSEELDNIWKDSQNFYNYKYREFNETDSETIKEIVTNEFIALRLRDIIKFHIKNINLLNRLDHEFRPTLAFEYTVMSISIIAGLLAGLENAFLQLPYTFVQLFIYCFVGQKLIDASNSFENALYSCGWENFDKNNRRTVVLMLMMSQKTLMVSAGGVAKLNFNCLMVILKSAYSAYTTLNSVVED